MADTKKKTKLTTNEVKKENTAKKTSKKVEEPSLKVKYGEKTPKTKETKIPKSKTQTKAVRKSKNAQDPNLDRDKKILKESGNLELKEDFVKNSTRTDLSNKPDIATHSLANYGTSVTRGRFKRKHIEKTSTERHLPEHGPIDEKTGKEILLSLKNVKITFGKGAKAVEAVKNATFDIFKGETFSLVGESGSGKTTIGRAVIRVNPLADGEICFKGVRISGNIPHSLDREVIRNIQMVFQDPAASLNERATVEYIVSEGLYNFHLYKNDADRVMKVEHMIKEVGLLPEHLTRYPHEFSGGQRQRIGIARAMVMEPELIVADEPISALDVSIRAQILNLLKKFQKEQGLTCLFIAHDLSIVRFISDRIGVIYKGDIVEIADGEELFNFPLHPYTKSLISAIPLPDPKIEKEKVLFTYDPSVHDYSEDKPELVDIGHNHFVYGNKAEIAKYKALRNKNVPLEVIKTSKDPKKHEKEIISMAAADEFLAKPVHDTGSNWYRLLSFILPIIGLPLAFIFKGHKYYRNYKACLKWSIISFIIIGVIIAIYLILLAFTLV